MTCIIGLAHEGKVYIGADSMSAAGWNQRQTKLRKVFRVGEFLIGYTSSFRMGQILQYHLEVRPQEENEPDERYMVVAFVEAVRDCLKAKGYSKVDNNIETGGFFVVGYKGEVYHINDDYQVNHYVDGLVTEGCGAPFALAAMVALAEYIPDPRERLLSALKITEQLSNGVIGPFVVEEST